MLRSIDRLLDQEIGTRAVSFTNLWGCKSRMTGSPAVCGRLPSSGSCVSCQYPPGMLLPSWYVSVVMSVATTSSVLASLSAQLLAAAGRRCWCWCWWFAAARTVCPCGCGVAIIGGGGSGYMGPSSPIPAPPPFMTVSSDQARRSSD